MLFYKYHALGNDYLILDAQQHPVPPSPEMIRNICNRHEGIGSDGILYGPIYQENEVFGLRIFNPDGSEAEKSGNGLRIFARYLWDSPFLSSCTCTLITSAGPAVCTRLNHQLIQVDMGDISIDPKPLELDLPEASVGYKASVGNPHLVIPVKETSPLLAKHYGPKLEEHPQFPNKTNVQFVEVLSPDTIKIEIWERGAGYTLASGTSSCAAAAVVQTLGLCGKTITVFMQGGDLQVELCEGKVKLTGPATPIAECKWLLTPQLVS